MLKDAFEDFLNAGAQNLPAKLLARRVDEVLREERPRSEEDLEGQVERIMAIFRYIAAKDAFEAFYKKDLAKRLLQQRSAADAEAFVLQQLREECIMIIVIVVINMIIVMIRRIIRSNSNDNSSDTNDTTQ